MKELFCPKQKSKIFFSKKLRIICVTVISYEDLCGDAETIVDIDEMTEEQLFEVVLEKGTEEQQEKYGAIERPLEEENDFFALKDIVDKILKKTVEVDENTLTANEKDGFRVMKRIKCSKKCYFKSIFIKVCKRGGH
jgi:hypothetical protein